MNSPIVLPSLARSADYDLETARRCYVALTEREPANAEWPVRLAAVVGEQRRRACPVCRRLASNISTTETPTPKPG